MSFQVVKFHKIWISIMEKIVQATAHCLNENVNMTVLKLPGKMKKSLRFCLYYEILEKKFLLRRESDLDTSGNGTLVQFATVVLQ